MILASWPGSYKGSQALRGIGEFREHIFSRKRYVLSDYISFEMIPLSMRNCMISEAAASGGFATAFELFC